MVLVLVLSIYILLHATFLVIVYNYKMCYIEHVYGFNYIILHNVLVSFLIIVYD